MKEHGDMSYSELREKSAAAATRFNELATQIKEMEAQMIANGKLKK